MGRRSRREAREMLEANIELVERIVESARRRGKLAGVDVDDFRSEVYAKLVDNDYAVLRRFAGKSRLGTYLTVVAQRVLLDLRAREWGKWRNSTAAKRLGPAAVALENLLWRDRFTLDEAVELLAARAEIPQSREELCDLGARLPRRLPRRFVGAERLDRLASSSSAEVSLCRREREGSARRLEAALNRALESLEPRDRQLLRLHFIEGKTVASIARRLDLNQRRLYSRLERLMGRLRGRLEAAGIGAARVRELFGKEALSLDLALVEEKHHRRPSRGVEAPDESRPTVMS